MKMKNGLELIKANSELLDIQKLEEMNNLVLPPVYRMFASYFRLDEFGYEKYFSSKYSDYFQLTGVYYEPKGLEENNIGITGLYSIEKVFEHYKNLQGYTDDDIEKKLIKIADIGYGGGIFIGTEGDNTDSIFLHSWDREPQYELLARNIFKFLQSIKQIELPEEDLIETKYSQLYKNYGEDFWRIREEKS